MAKYQPIPDDWGRNESDLWTEMVDASGGGSQRKTDLHNDDLLRELYDTALYNWDITPAERRATMTTLIAYLDEFYDVDFDDIFDWEGYRENYDTQVAS